ncbi:hypothetical protein BASA81_007058 [Batrachochytrium salamandrivorans]|nr:hypothetical protein BASA81_010809 [Batrachochytrium salamandrivorans]KAH9254808.1 hypothetical protein BASA81_007058 [Batrachochytrium salamandrivorans]
MGPMLVLSSRTRGELLDAGAAPFYRSPNGGLLIPNGYRMRTEFEGCAILGETKVFVYGRVPRVEYQFSALIGGDIPLDGGFQISPYLASVCLNSRLANLGIHLATFDPRSDDNFELGVTSSSVQAWLRTVHAKALQVEPSCT